jgi:hypothetical protein
MILDMTRFCVHLWEQMPLRIEPGHQERFVSRKIIVFEVQVVVNQRGPQIGIVADSIAADPWIHQRKGQKKEKKQHFCVPRGSRTDRKRHSRGLDAHRSVIEIWRFTDPCPVHFSTHA